MKSISKIIFVLSLVVFCNKTYAQLDTLKYLKQIEINKAEYEGKKFSTLYRKLKIKPEVFSHFLSAYSSSSIFYIKKGAELGIEWLDSPYSYSNKEIDSHHCSAAQKCLLTKEIKAQFDQLRIKKLAISMPENNVMTVDIGQLKPVKNISKFVKDRLSGIYDLKNSSFADLLMRIRPLSPIMIKNITNNKNKICISHITFSFRDQHISNDTISLEIIWKSPIKYKNKEDAKSYEDTVFTDEDYNLYWEEKIENIRFSNKQ